MKYIELNKGYQAIVDDEDYDRLMKYNWFVEIKDKNNTVYACRNDGNSKPFMHREVLGLTDPTIYTDHKNGNGLDNRKCNLRPCTPRQNNANRPKRSDSNNKYKGITWHKRDQRWEVHVYPKNSKRKYVGSSQCEITAAKMYNEAAKKYYGEFAYLNDV